MKEKRNCKIIQDLLPNYIEKLTNDETNQYVEEHLKECEECKNVFENMKKEIELDSKKQDEREVKYIKKYNNKLRILRNALLFIIIIFVIIVGRKFFIITNLSDKASKSMILTNYYTKTVTYSNDTMSILESYNKDGIISATMKMYSKDYDNRKIIMYKSDNEALALIESDGNKTLVSKNVLIGISPVYFTGENLFHNFFMALTTSVDKINLNGKNCYLIKHNNTEKFIDTETGLAVKMIDNNNNRTTDFYYEFDVVKDSDVKRPDTTGYVEE